MARLPDAVFVVDTRKEKIAVDEARKLKIPVIGVVDTNCDPDEVDFVIPGNDDALRAIRLFASRIADAVIAGRGLRQAGHDEATARPTRRPRPSAARVPRGARDPSTRRRPRRPETRRNRPVVDDVGTLCPWTAPESGPGISLRRWFPTSRVSPAVFRPAFLRTRANSDRRDACPTGASRRMTMAITAEQVKALRDKTGAGMMECKAALTEANGDSTKAIDPPSQEGAARQAAKRAGRATKQGAVGTTHMPVRRLGRAKVGVLVEVNCESDFVARPTTSRRS